MKSKSEGLDSVKLITFVAKNTNFRKKISALLLISVVTITVYFGSINNLFTTWDDPVYILNNPHIKELSVKSILRIFQTPEYMRNYQPVVLVSYAVDHYFYSFKSYGYHITNLLFHLCNVILVWILFYLLAEELTLATVVALFFAIHPMHVESVAWLSARSDLLFTFFYISSIICYLLYRHQTDRKRYYLFSIILFLFSLISKALAVSLPFVLLLFDYYASRKFDRKMLFEKIPFFVISLMGGIIAFLVRQPVKISSAIGTYSFLDRMLLGSYSTVTYLWKLLTPVQLCAIYNFPGENNGLLPAGFWLYLFCVALIVIVIIYSCKYSKKYFFGMMFFFITIVSVLPFFNLPLPIMADRYSYLPSLGLFFVIAVGIQEIKNKLLTKKSFKTFRSISVALLGMYILWLGHLTLNKIKVWKDGVTLWTDVIESYPNDSGPYKNRGMAYLTTERYVDAIADFTHALELRPQYPDALIGRGVAFIGMNNYDNALVDFTTAAELEPQNATVYFNKGFTLANLDRYGEAIKSYSIAIELKHDYGEAYVNRGFAELQLGDTAVACSDLYHAAKELQFEPAKTYYNEICRKK
jgi:hypothetical protein